MFQVLEMLMQGQGVIVKKPDHGAQLHIQKQKHQKQAMQLNPKSYLFFSTLKFDRTTYNITETRTNQSHCYRNF